MKLQMRNKVTPEFTMAAMTDFVFQLLIIFMLISTLVSETNVTDLDLPKAEQKTPASTTPKAPISIGVTPENTYFINNNHSQQLSYNEAKEQLIALMSQNTDKKIKIAGDKTSDYEAVFKIISLSQVQGWKPLLAYDKSFGNDEEVSATH
jgi:biopolymer transport protein ExbD